MDKSKRQLQTDNEHLTELLHASQAEIRRLKANPPETIRRVIVEHKPLPKPISGQAVWLDQCGAVRHHCRTMITFPDTHLYFMPAQIGIPTDNDVAHEQFALRIRWELPR